MQRSWLLFFALWSNPAKGAFGSPKVDSIGVTKAKLSQFELLAQYAGAAYCYNNVHGTPKTVRCSPEGGSCPRVETANAKVLKTFSEAGSSKTVGFVALDDAHQLILMAIQGTSVESNPTDFFTDVDFIKRNTTLCGEKSSHDGCQVHEGFYGAMIDAAKVVNPVIEELAEAHPTYKIVTTGHSLGAAVAALLGTQLRNEGRIVDIYTYGQPHVGDSDISNYIQSQSPAKGNNYRITHTNDVIPQMPLHGVMPYWGAWNHYYPEYWVDTDVVPVPSTKIKVITGHLYQDRGNEGATSGWGIIVDLIQGVSAHSRYFGPISTCTSMSPES